MRTRARTTTVIAVATLMLAACSDGEDGEADPVDLEADDQSAEVEDEPPSGDGDEADGEPGDDDTTDEDAGSAEDDGADEGNGEDATGGTDPDEGGRGDLVDTTEAVPGTWPVGAAGTVTFSIVDGELVLDDVTPADGWREEIDAQDADEIEVDLRRDDVEWEIEIELEDGGTILEIEIRQDIEDADPGSYDLGDAGTFALEVDDDRLVLTDLSVTDGWTVVERDEEADEIELELTNGPRGFDVEVEHGSDGRIEVEIDYEVVGPATG